MARHVANELDRDPGPEWLETPERGSLPTIRFMAWIALALGRPAARLLLYPICCYFFLFSARARAASKAYLRRVLDREPGVLHIVRHFHCFAATILDRAYLLNDQFERFDVRVVGADVIGPMLARGSGCILLGAHMGSFEVVRSVGRQAGVSGVSIAMFEDNARKIGSVIEAINPGLHRQVIALGQVDSVLKLEAALQRGEAVGILADRALTDEGSVECDFLGAPARFPTGPLRIAAVLKCPVVLMLGLYLGGNRYEVHFEPLAGMTGTRPVDRDQLVGDSLRRYAARLEHFCRVAPYNWFNFYDYWR